MQFPFLDMEEFSMKLRIYKAVHGISNNAMAEKIGVSSPTVGRLAQINTDYDPYVSLINKLYTAYPDLQNYEVPITENVTLERHRLRKIKVNNK